MKLCFLVPGPPFSWKRAGRVQGGRSFSLHKQIAYQERIRTEARAEIARMALRGEVWPIDAAYQVRVEVVPFDRHYPDADNMAKQVCDALQGTAARRGKPARQAIAWTDDKRVHTATATVYEARPACGIVVTAWASQPRPAMMPNPFPVHTKPRKKPPQRPKAQRLRVRLEDGPCRLTHPPHMQAFAGPREKPARFGRKAKP